MKRPFVYTMVTEHWPKLATVLVASVGALELVLNNSGSNIEWYLLAWGSITGGLWFLFDIAEKSTPIEIKNRLSEVINSDGRDEYFDNIPDRFANMFDQIFGSKHLSWLCFRRSVMASIICAWIVSAFVYSIYPAAFGRGFAATLSDPVIDEPLINIGMLGTLALFINLIPDYLSLMQTRYMLRWIKSGAQAIWILLADFALTSLIFVTFVLTMGILMIVVVWIVYFENYAFFNDPVFREDIVSVVFEMLQDIFFIENRGGNNFGILLLTTYFTSFWLWVYIATIALARLLTRLNRGIGILLRVVDVEQQPLRSVGFVSVIIISALFVLGLPFVVW